MESTGLLVTFARPEESRAFRRRMQAGATRLADGDFAAQGLIASAPVSVAHTGIGPEAAGVKIGRLLAKGRWNLVIGAGFAGGLTPRLGVGDTLMEEIPGKGPRRIISAASPVETAVEKRALHLETGAEAVDMETETLAKACESAGVPFLALRAISDAAETDLPVPFGQWFDMARQRPRPLGLLRYLATHPSRLLPFVRFVRAIPQVSAALALAIEGCIASTEQ